MKIGRIFGVFNSSDEINDVKEIMEESNAINELLNEKSEVMNQLFSDIDPELKAVKKEVINGIAEMRTPEVLNTRITVGLTEKNLTEAAWETASDEERRAMMDRMFDTMIEEMQVSDEIRKDLQLLHTGSSDFGTMVISGHCNRFIGLNESGVLAVTEKPVVEMHYALSQQEFDTVLGSLYNQAIKVMQQSTCIEPAGTYADTVEQAKWVAEVKDQINGKFAQISDMQKFAVKAEKDMFKCYNKNKGLSLE